MKLMGESFGGNNRKIIMSIKSPSGTRIKSQSQYVFGLVGRHPYRKYRPINFRFVCFIILIVTGFAPSVIEFFLSPAKSN